MEKWLPLKITYFTKFIHWSKTLWSLGLFSLLWEMLWAIKKCHIPSPNPGHWDLKLTSWLESPIHKEELRRAACTVRKACWWGSVMLTRCMFSFWHSLSASVQVRVFRIILYRLFWYFTVSEVFCKVCLLSVSVC